MLQVCIPARTGCSSGLERGEARGCPPTCQPTRLQKQLPGGMSDKKDGWECVASKEWWHLKQRSPVLANESAADIADQVQLQLLARRARQSATGTFNQRARGGCCS
eukprot:GHUV01033374.1.p1 GENE.GHUV01033374.1~~GHUV01033374.1.p1  ORF type:complete len:106 (+),score=10.54 GHUV01033374.1:933-1250(+)